MQLIKWEPLSEAERLFDSFSIPSLKINWDMSVDLYEENENLIARINVPGVNPENIEVSLKNNTLHLSGSREDEKEVKDKHYYSKEIRRGEFERYIHLPKSIDKKRVEAEYKEGALNITMPIIEDGKGDTVKVKIKK